HNYLALFWSLSSITQIHSRFFPSSCCDYTSAPISSFCKSTTDGDGEQLLILKDSLALLIRIESHTHDVGLNNTKLVHWDDVCLIFQVAGTDGINL
ncbi:hypothetical protein LINPERPRIM_LOCUS1324, partial [Linum perenne]